jgi:hypothetical protein
MLEKIEKHYLNNKSLMLFLWLFKCTELRKTWVHEKIKSKFHCTQPTRNTIWEAQVSDFYLCWYHSTHTQKIMDADPFTGPNC